VEATSFFSISVCDNDVLFLCGCLFVAFGNGFYEYTAHSRLNTISCRRTVSFIHATCLFLLVLYFSTLFTQCCCCCCCCCNQLPIILNFFASSVVRTVLQSPQANVIDKPRLIFCNNGSVTVMIGCPRPPPSSPPSSMPVLSSP
jgi:hypothetical protein